MPISETLIIFKQYLPPVLYYKIAKYVTAPADNLRCTISWSFCKEKLDNINLEDCISKLLTLYTNMSCSESNVKVFHIGDNLKSKHIFEPTHTNTTKMIKSFLTFIYQRNVLASITKYILLKPLLDQFKTSSLVQQKKGIFFNIQTRLEEILFESVLFAFNGAKYDNYLICNHLFLLISRLHAKIKVFKKGSAISTIKIIIKNNINITEKQKKLKHVWPLNLYIKDIRDLVAANMSLDKVGQLFNLPVSKLCFPYEQATSIRVLRKNTSLHPYNEKFWADNFSGKIVPLEKRLFAQNIFETKKFSTLYEYSVHYLVQDCMLLQSVVNTLFSAHLQNSVNIFTRRVYSQSSLAYQQFFILEPAKQIDKILAPKKFNNKFYNYFIKQAVTGGLCTSFVHQTLDQTTIINEHLKYFDKFNLDPQKWPNFDKVLPKDFNQLPCGINTIDIRSLYPSAALKGLPVNSPLFYSRLTRDNAATIGDKKFNSIPLQKLCQNVRDQGDFNQDIFHLFSASPPFQTEYQAINWFLQTLPKNIDIVHFQSGSTALGQLYFVEWPLDAFLSYKQNEELTICLIQYNSVYIHGHRNTCKTANDDEQQKKADQTDDIKSKITNLMTHYLSHFNRQHISFKYVEISDCDFLCHKIPTIKPFIFPYKKQYTYKSFLTNIFNNKLSGLLVVKDLEIKKNGQNPILGFIVQKIQYELRHLSDYTQKILKYFNPFPRVIAVHKAKAFMVISTEYFVWLHNMFGFENTPDIFHALLFQTDTYLKSSIENKLKERKQLKELIKIETDLQRRQVYEIKAELIKLMVNSCYGFTLCNLTSTKFKSFENRRCLPYKKKAREKINSCVKIDDNVYIVELKKTIKEPFETLLGHVGCYILFNSKIILLKRLYFLLKYLNPSKAQLLYMDTDSAHFLVKHKKFEENVDSNLQCQFISEFDQHFDTGPKISGIWVQEGFYTSARYIGEKSYVLSNKENNSHLSHMKGLNSAFQAKFCDENIDTNETPYVSYNLFYKSSDFTIFKIYNNKNLFGNFVPIKRYFVCASGSLPLRL